MRILIVEDDPLLADGLTQTLRRQGYLADCVSSAEKADAAVAQEEFGLVLLDVGLPGMDGFELLRRWHQIVGGVCTWEDELSPKAVEVFQARSHPDLSPLDEDPAVEEVRPLVVEINACWWGKWRPTWWTTPWPIHRPAAA